MASREWPPRAKKSSPELHRRPPEELREDPGQQLLQRSPRRRLQDGLGWRGLRQRRAVDLAGRRQRPVRHQDKGGRDHGVRKLGAQLAPQLLGRWRRGEQVGDEPRFAGRIARHDDGLAHPGQGVEPAFDLPQLHSLAAHLDLRVAAPDELQAAVRQPAPEIAGAVDPPVATLGIGQEGGRGQPRPAPVLERQVPAADRDLAHPVERRLLARRIEQPHLGVLDRMAYRHRIAPDLAVWRGEELQRQRRLGRPQAVDEERVRPEMAAEALEVLPHALLAAQNHEADAGKPLLPRFVEEAPVERRRGVEDGDSLARDPGREPGRPLALDVERAERGAVEQRAEDVHHCGVEGVGGQQAQPVLGDQMEGVGVRPDVVQHVAVALHHALGHAGRARGIEDVGRRLRGDLRSDTEKSRPLVPALSQDQHATAGQLPRHLAMGFVRQDRGGLGVLDHEGETGARIAGVERHVGLAGLERREHAGDPRRALGEQQADPVRTLAERGEQGRRPAVRFPVEIGVGPDLALMKNSRVLGEEPGDLGEAARERRLDRLGREKRPGVCRRHPLAPLEIHRQRQLRKPPRGVGRRRAEQRREVPAQTLHLQRFEERRVVVEEQLERAAALAGVDGQVDLGRERRQVEDLDPHPRQIGHCLGDVEQVEQHLEERRAVEVALQPEVLQQPLERQVLVRVRAQARLADPGDDLPEARVPGEVGADRQRVEEDADEPFGLQPVAAGDRGADDEVGLAGVAGEQGLEAGEQDHERGGPFPAAEVPQAGGQLRGDADHGGGPPPRSPSWPRRGQLQRRRRRRDTAQTLPPPGELRLQHAAAHPVALPAGKVGVLHHQRRQERGPSRQEGGIERVQLVHQDADRPGVSRHMVERGHQPVLLAIQAHQEGAQHRPRAQVERPQRLLHGHPARLALAPFRGQPG